MVTNELIKKYCNELAETLTQKNHDYGNSVQEQFQEYGLDSILIRLDDKMRRLKTLRTITPHVREESLKDTLKDLSGYALLGLMCLVLEEQEKKQAVHVEKMKAIDLPSINLMPTSNKTYSSPIDRAVPTETWLKLEDIKQHTKKPPYADLDD